MVAKWPQGFSVPANESAFLDMIYEVLRMKRANELLPASPMTPAGVPTGNDSICRLD